MENNNMLHHTTSQLNGDKIDQITLKLRKVGGGGTPTTGNAIILEYYFLQQVHFGQEA